MSRMYFDTNLDPAGTLKAMYMAVEFGVIFEVQTVDVDGIDYSNHQTKKLYPSQMRGGIREDCLVDNINKRSNKYQTYYASNLFRFGNLYVSKESESIFEPLEGDIGHRETLCDSGFSVGRFDGERWYCKTGREDGLIIIMRDNKHFFNPMIEQ